MYLLEMQMIDGDKHFVLHVYHSFVQLCFVQRGRAGEIHDTCIGLIEGEIFPLYLAVPKNAYYCFAACAQIDMG